MMKGIVKIASTLVLSMMLFVGVATFTPVLATTSDTKTIIDTIDKTQSTVDTSKVQSIAGQVLSVIRTVAVIAGVILIAVLGIKYMMGSASEKAEYKKSMIPLIVGAIVVMAASQLATMLFTVVS